ncbi:MAG: hypothetical protein NTV33_06290 [Coprothermobacterota bacterium]|nr:hypothetical protein [Coprothermobacterota bacterium]
MKRWLVFLLVACCFLPSGGAWAEGLDKGSPPALSAARYQIPYCAVRGGISFSGSYAADLSTAYVHAGNFNRRDFLACFSMDAMVQGGKVTYLSLILYQGMSSTLAQRFLYFLPANRYAGFEGQGTGIRIDQLDTWGHDFLGGILEDFWPMPVAYEQNPFWPLMMLFSPLISQTGQYRPLAEVDCKEISGQLQAVLPVTLAVGTSSFEFGGTKLGQCCRLSAWGWGATVGVQANDRIRQFFSDHGWIPVLRLFADGRFGAIAGYRQGKKLAVVELMVEPIANLVDNPDIPIEMLEIPDEKMHYELTISIAELP